MLLIRIAQSLWVFWRAVHAVEVLLAGFNRSDIFPLSGHFARLRLVHLDVTDEQDAEWRTAEYLFSFRKEDPITVVSSGAITTRISSLLWNLGVVHVSIDGFDLQRGFPKDRLNWLEIGGSSSAPCTFLMHLLDTEQLRNVKFIRSHSQHRHLDYLDTCSELLWVHRSIVVETAMGYNECRNQEVPCVTFGSWYEILRNQSLLLEAGQRFIHIGVVLDDPSTPVCPSRKNLATSIMENLWLIGADFTCDAGHSNVTNHQQTFEATSRLKLALTALNRTLGPMSSGPEEKLDAPPYDSFLNRTFNYSGRQFVLDHSGRYQMDLTLWRWEKSETKAVCKWDAFRQRVVSFGDNCLRFEKLSRSHQVLPPNAEPLAIFRVLKNPFLVIIIILGSAYLVAAAWVLKGLHHKEATALASTWWSIKLGDIKRDPDRQTPLRNLNTKLHDHEGHGSWNGQEVWLNLLLCNTLNISVTPTLKVVKAARQFMNKIQHIHHPNINRFIGLTVATAGNLQRVYLVNKYCSRGSLQDLIAFMHLDHHFRSALIIDFLEGLNFIHGSEFGFHGKLAGFRCLISNRFILKIGHTGRQNLRNLLSTPWSYDPGDDDHQKLFWTAPEILREKQPASKKTDIYSAAIVLYEIAACCLPYSENNGMTPKEIISSVVTENHMQNGRFLRPSFVGHSVAPSVQKILKRAWSDQPNRRPKARQLRSSILAALGFTEQTRSDTVDNHIQRMEKFIEKLEADVCDVIHGIDGERSKRNLMLQESIPRDLIDEIAELMRNPQRVENVTVLSLTVANVTRKAGELSPNEVLSITMKAYEILENMLDCPYTCRFRSSNMITVLAGLQVFEPIYPAEELLKVALEAVGSLEHHVELQNYQIDVRCAMDIGNCFVFGLAASPLKMAA